MTGAPRPWTDAEVRAALGLRADPGRPALTFTGVTTDSRSVTGGDLFVALVGERFDGHAYVADAVAAGARAAVVSHSAPGAQAVPLYPVPDTLEALGALALHRRGQLQVPVVGVTGSSGKTGTKDLLRGALGAHCRVHATRGNLNNRVGLPLTLLAAPDDVEALVLEMGTNEPGEIATLTAIARPEVGVVTTVGESHLEKLGSVQGVLREKTDLLRGLPADGVAVVGDHPASLVEAARRLPLRVRVAGWGGRADPDLRPADVEVDAAGRHRFTWRGERVALAVPGRHAVANALLALAVAELLDVPPAVAARGMGQVRPGSLRGEVRRLGGLTLLLDCYNANPQSVRAAMDLLEVVDAPGRVAVLGTMLELGPRSAELHQEVLEDALTRTVDLVVATGAFAAAASRVVVGNGGKAGLVAEEDPARAYHRLRPRLGGHETVLLKASRGVALEALLPAFEADFGDAAAPGKEAS